MKKEILAKKNEYDVEWGDQPTNHPTKKYKAMNKRLWRQGLSTQQNISYLHSFVSESIPYILNVYKHTVLAIKSFYVRLSLIFHVSLCPFFNEPFLFFCVWLLSFTAKLTYSQSIIWWKCLQWSGLQQRCLWHKRQTCQRRTPRNHYYKI